MLNAIVVIEVLCVDALCITYKNTKYWYTYGLHYDK